MYGDQQQDSSVPDYSSPIGKASDATLSANVSALTTLSGGSGFGIRLSERRLLLITIDSLFIILAIWGAHVLTGRAQSLSDSLGLARTNWYWLPLLLLGWWMLAWLNDLYDVPSSTDTTQTMARLVVAGAISLLSYSLVHIFIPAMPDPHYIASYLVLALPLIALWRRAYIFSFDRPPFHHRVLIVGTGKPGHVIADALTQNKLQEGPGIKYKLVGYVLTQAADDAGADGIYDGITPGQRENGPGTGLKNGPGTALNDGPLGLNQLPHLGRATDLPLLVRQLGIHEVIVAMERQLDADLFALLVDCQAQGVRVSWMPDLYSKLYRQFPIECIDPGWAMQAMQDRPIFDRLQQMSKRALDLLVVISALPLLLLFVLPVAIAIRLDSKGPVFYRQVRLGRGNRPFTIVKFRTMVEDAEKDGQARWATDDDPRITRVGRLLRKSRLDELPQIFNVLKGHMSLVGPRPERPEFIAELKDEIPFYGIRLMVKPGITGWAQIHYDYGNSMEDASVKLQYDFYYIRYWSLWLDLYIMYRTAAVIARLKGT